MNRLSPPIALLVLAAACSKEAAPESTSYSFVDSTGGVTIETAGIRIEVAGSVRYRYQFLSTSPGASNSEATLNGHPFGLRNGIVFIGEKEYGAAPAGAAVRVNDEGVFVDGERRGQVPEAAPEEPGE